MYINHEKIGVCSEKYKPRWIRSAWEITVHVSHLTNWDKSLINLVLMVDGESMCILCIMFVPNYIFNKYKFMT